jgi:hypothetical protein
MALCPSPVCSGIVLSLSPFFHFSLRMPFFTCHIFLLGDCFPLANVLHLSDCLTWFLDAFAALFKMFLCECMYNPID